MSRAHRIEKTIGPVGAPDDPDHDRDRKDDREDEDDDGDEGLYDDEENDAPSEGQDDAAHDAAHNAAEEAHGSSAEAYAPRAAAKAPSTAGEDAWGQGEAGTGGARPHGFAALAIGTTTYPADRFTAKGESIGYRALESQLQKLRRTLETQDRSYPARMIHAWWAEAPGKEFVLVDVWDDFLDEKHRAGEYHVRVKFSPEPDIEQPGDIYYTCSVPLAPAGDEKPGVLTTNLALLRENEQISQNLTTTEARLKKAHKKIDKLRADLHEAEDELHDLRRQAKDLEDEVERLKAADAGAPIIADDVAEQGMIGFVAMAQQWAQNPGGRPQERLLEIWNANLRFWQDIGSTPVMEYLAKERPKALDRLMSTLNKIAQEEGADACFVTSRDVLRAVAQAQAQASTGRGLPPRDDRAREDDRRARSREDRPHEAPREPRHDRDDRRRDTPRPPPHRHDDRRPRDRSRADHGGRR